MNIGDIKAAGTTLRLAEGALEKEVRITPQQLVFLDFVGDSSGSVILSDLTEHLNCTPAVTTGLADRLEKRGYIVRIGDKGGDRRRTYLAITELGQDVLWRASVALERITTNGR